MQGFGARFGGLSEWVFTRGCAVRIGHETTGFKIV